MCDDILTDLPLFVAGTLADGRRRAVEAHLAGCPACRAALGEWQLLVGQVRAETAARVVTLPPYLPPSTPPATAPRRHWPHAVGGSLAFLVALLALFGGPRWASVPWPGDRHPLAATPAPSRSFAAPTAVVRRLAPAIPPVRVVAAGPAGRMAPESGEVVPDRPQSAGSPADGGAISQAALAPRSEPAPAAEPVMQAPATPVTEPPASDPGEAPAPRSPAAPAPTAPVAPTAPAPPGVVGVVVGPDGLGRAEVRVLARSAEGGAARITGTDPDGRYALDLPPGRWLMAAVAPAYQAVWYPGRPDPVTAAPVEVGSTGPVTVDFALAAAPTGLVTGVVAGAGAGAVVVAAPAADGAEPAWRFRAAAVVDEGGVYALALPPGAWYVAAMADWRGTGLVWWRTEGSTALADPIVVDEGGPAVTVRLSLTEAAP